MEYCDDVMKKEKDMSPDPNGDSETTNAIAPDSGRYQNIFSAIYKQKTAIRLSINVYLNCESICLFMEKVG